MISAPLLKVVATLQNRSLWGTLGWADIKFRYRRTVLGPFWLTISTGMMVFAIGLLYAVLLNKDMSTYIPSLAIGMIIWMFFSTSLTEGCSVFIVASGIIKAYTISLSTHVFRLLWRNIIIFLHNVLIIVVVWIIFRWSLSPLALLSVLGFAMLLAFIFGLVMLFGVLCTRFRDIPLIITAMLQLFFFLTPIMWSPDDLGPYRWVVELNPLFSLIEIVRAPLMNHMPDLKEWLIATGCTTLSLFCGLAFYARYQHRVAYWL
jgi:lipopolysaccharide transport system permease protein